MTQTSRYPTVDALKQLMGEMALGESDVQLGQKSREILGKLLDTPEKVAMSSISELATEFSVSPSTFTRLAKNLGYQGFNAFQGVFRESLAIGTGYFYSQQAHHLFEDDAVAQSDQTLVQITQDTVQNLNLSLRQLDNETFEQTAQLLATAPRVRLYAERQFYALTAFLGYGLSLVRKDVSLLDTQRMGLVSTLNELSERDVLLVVSCEPYTRTVIEVAQAARSCGVKIVALTDYRASPLASVATHSFFIPHKSSFISNSMGAHIVFAEALVNRVAACLGKKAAKALKQHEQLLDSLNVSY